MLSLVLAVSASLAADAPTPAIAPFTTGQAENIKPLGLHI